MTDDPTQESTDSLGSSSEPKRRKRRGSRTQRDRARNRKIIGLGVAVTLIGLLGMYIWQGTKKPATSPTTGTKVSTPSPVRPASRILPVYPSATADNTTLRFSSPADAMAMSGGGRFLVARLPATRQLAVLDLVLGRVLEQFPIPDERTLFTVGMTKLFTYSPTANLLQQWDLIGMRKEATVEYKLGGNPRVCLVGSQTDGPVFLAGPNVTSKHFVFLDPDTFREIEVTNETTRIGPGVSAGVPTPVRVSPDGRTFIRWSDNRSGSACETFVYEDGRTIRREAPLSNSIGDGPLVGPNGFLYSNLGVMTNDFVFVQASPANERFDLIPAVAGPWYLRLSPGNGTTPREGAVHAVGVNQPLFQLGSLPELGVSPSAIPLAERIAIVPEADLLVMLSPDGAACHLRRLDLAKRLAAYPNPYLLVVDRPDTAIRGRPYQYRPKVLSKAGGVTLRLESGPVGMSVSGDALQWMVPTNFAETDVGMVLIVTDSAGQETICRFRVEVVSRS